MSERVRAAAIRLRGSEVFEGDDHYYARVCAGFQGDHDAYFDLLDAGHAEEGFTTTTGRFLDREQAFVLALSTKQATRSCEGSLLAEYVHAFADA